MNQRHTDGGPNSFISGLLVGGLLGAIAALWLAPQSGKKTQQMISKEAHRLQRTAEDTVEDLKKNAENTSNDIREKADAARHDGQEWLDHQADKVGKAASKVRNTVTG